MAEEAEYLRVGTTMLALDALEAGYLSKVPLISRPIKALRIFCADPSLEAKVRCKDGVLRSALDIQRHYYEACARLVAESPDANDEARDILSRWGEVLSLLETNPGALVGRLDWITKRFLLEQTQDADADTDQAVKKKIDIRYHELSPDGYYRRLETTGCTRAILSADEIEDATHFPPHDSPATKRSRYLRAFSRAEKTLRVNWNTITLGRGSDAKTIELNEPEETEPELESPTPLPNHPPIDPDEKDIR